MQIWIVWERNSIVPRVFDNEDAARHYREQRSRLTRNTVHIVPGKVESRA